MSEDKLEMCEEAACQRIFGYGLADADPTEREVCRGAVKDILAELRVPSEAMLAAAWQWTQNGSTSEQRMATALGGTRQSHDYKMRRRLKAMIDAVGE